MASARVASRFRDHCHHIVAERNCAIGRDGHRTRNKTCENQNEKEQHLRTGEGLATQAYCVTVCHDRIVKPFDSAELLAIQALRLLWLYSVPRPLPVAT